MGLIWNGTPIWRESHVNALNLQYVSLDVPTEIEANFDHPHNKQKKADPHQNQARFDPHTRGKRFSARTQSDV